MGKLWDRKSFEVGGHWPLWRGWKNRVTTQNRQKSNAKNNNKKNNFDKVYFSILERWIVQLLNTNILYIVLKISSPDGRLIYYSLIPI